MTKKNKKLILITSIITILPVFVGLILWNKLPEQIPTHFDADGIILAAFRQVISDNQKHKSHDDDHGFGRGQKIDSKRVTIDPKRTEQGNYRADP